MWIIFALMVFVLILLILNIRIVPQSQSFIIERLGG